MCGIAGIVHFNQTPVDEEELARVTHAMEHRGPDGFDFYRQRPVGLGHRRLAIIDLESGKQPIMNEDGTVWLTFNGKIYNFMELRSQLVSKGHSFKTHADSEVIVHGYEEWGHAVVEHLRGMFAFAIWDEKRQEVFLARDRVGIKTLVYYSDGHRFAFASEIQALRKLLGFNAGVEMKTLDMYLYFQYIPAPYSIYKKVRKLLPASTMVVKLGGTIRVQKPYWDLHFKGDSSYSEEAWVERLDEALSDAVQSHLVSDVPFAFLSGGVDSSAITAYMSQHLEEPVKAFNMGYEEQECDEADFARIAAQSVGVHFHTEKIKPDVLAILPTLAEAWYGRSPFWGEEFLKKIGFSISVSQWLAGPLHDTFCDRLLGQQSPLSKWFDSHYMKTMLDEHRGGEVDHGHRLWSLMFFSEWSTGR